MTPCLKICKFDCEYEAQELDQMPSECPCQDIPSLKEVLNQPSVSIDLERMMRATRIKVAESLVAVYPEP